MSSHLKPLPPAREVAAPPGYEIMTLFDPFEAFVGPFFDKRVPQDGPGFDGKGELWASFFIDERHVNTQGICHGGMLMSFADATLGIIAWRINNQNPSVTLSMQTNFLKAGRIGDLVEVRPRLERKASGILFASGSFEVNGEPLFTATSLWKLKKPS
ncbi:MAG: PaaI family thioesterase [Alphaproteobacteria bacterium]|nr:MAG: PaaI family thioesterase [Alphaproteobacteria bacterium]